MSSSHRLAWVAALLLVAGCERSAAPAPSAEAGALALTTPSALQVRAVDEANLVPRVRVNGELLSVARTANGWRTSLVVPEGGPADIYILWFERIGFRELPLAEYRISIASVDRDRSIRVFPEDYETDQLDFDIDGVSNIAERIANSDPFDENDPGTDFAQVFLPFIDPADAPDIDGEYDGIWDDAQFLDRDRFRLDIDNLMIDQGASRLDGDTEYRWAGMHDGENLYLLVFGEGANGQTPFGDSDPDVWNDDAVELFFDGDNSKLQAYDGIDDRQIIIPLTVLGEASSNRSDDGSGRFLLGFQSAPLQAQFFDFATCLCDGAQQLYEIRVNLAATNIQVDRTFGFEIQLDDDRDGGQREAKWGWFHPSRGNNDVDNTKDSPVFMSTVRLQPPIGS